MRGREIEGVERKRDQETEEGMEGEGGREGGRVGEGVRGREIEEER